MLNLTHSLLNSYQNEWWIREHFVNLWFSLSQPVQLLLRNLFDTMQSIQFLKNLMSEKPLNAKQYSPFPRVECVCHFERKEDISVFRYRKLDVRVFDRVPVRQWLQTRKRMSWDTTWFQDHFKTDKKMSDKECCLEFESRNEKGPEILIAC